MCSLEVDALIATTALTSKDWPIWLLRPPIQRLTPGNKSWEPSKGFPQSPGSKRKKGNKQKKADYVEAHGRSAPEETYESHVVSLVIYETKSGLRSSDGAASPTSSDERSDPATGDPS